MRARPLTAAFAAATLVLGGAVATALPAQAAECTDGCLLDVTVDAPAKIGIGGGWNEFTIDVANPTDDAIEVTEVELTASGDVELGFDQLYLDKRQDDDSWWAVEEDFEDDSAVYDLESSFVLGAQESETIELRVAAIDDFILEPLFEAMFALDPETDDLVGSLDGISDVSVDIDLAVGVTGLVVDSDDDPAVIGVGDATTNVSAIDISVEPTDLAFTVGEPATLTASLTNSSESNYENVLLLPIVPGVDLLGGLGGGGMAPFSGGNSPEDGLELLSELTEDSGTVVERLVDDEWRELDFVPDEDTGDLLLDVPAGGTAGTDWRFTFTDESVIETPTWTEPGEDEDYDTTYYGDDILWMALQLNFGEGDDENDLYYDLPDMQVLGFESNSVSIAVPLPPEEETPVDETPTPTTPPAVDSDDTDEGTDDDSGVADEDSGVADAGDGNDDGAGSAPTGEVAQTGYELTDQAALGLLLLVAGGIAVLATVRRRQAGTRA